MRAAVLEAEKTIRIKDLDVPEPAENEVLVRVHYTGVCGSDVPRVLEGRVHSFPIVLGHEFSGRVLRVGSGVDTSLIGTRVAGIPLIPCGECGLCVEGLFSLCSEYSFVGSRCSGSMSEYVLLPSMNVFPIDDGVDDLQAAFFEPATVAAHAVLCSGFKPGARAAVIGAGTIGLLLAQILLAQGASSVAVCNRSEARLAVARGITGVVTVCMSDPDWNKTLDASLGGLPEFVFDTVASSDTIAASAAISAPRGTVCFVGTPKSSISLEARQWEALNRKELSWTGTWMSYSAPWPGSEWDMVSKLFSEGSLVVLDGMVDTIYPLGRTADAFARFEETSSVNGKILIDSWEV